MEANKHPERRLFHHLTLPIIWAPFPAIIALDIIMELYHRTCFPLYGLPYIKRRDYIRIDRYKLPYLTLAEKIGCLYCEYANGFVAYGTAIAGATEKYWCGIKHKKYAGFHEPAHHAEFAEYGDEQDFKQRFPKT